METVMKEDALRAGLGGGSEKAEHSSTAVRISSISST